MTKNLYLLYLPGIGDAGGRFQPRAVNTWKYWGVESELYSMHWADDVPWEDKFAGLLSRIDELSSEYAVALVGASAGAAAAVNAYAARKDKLVGIICICGKINNPDTIGKRYRGMNPSFVTAAYQTSASLDQLNSVSRKRILCRYALFDQVIYTKADSRVPGARNRLVPSLFHSPTIALEITFGAPSFIRFLKKQTG
jgi:pimeloyl-ACP methyl ester carboxylesterase